MSPTLCAHKSSMSRICAEFFTQHSATFRSTPQRHAESRVLLRSVAKNNLTKGRIAAAHGRYFLYFTVGRPSPPQNCPLPVRDLDPHVIHGSMDHPNPRSKRHLDRFSRFCRAHDRNRHTDRPTDRQTYRATLSVSIGRICVHTTAMRPKK